MTLNSVGACRTESASASTSFIQGLKYIITMSNGFFFSTIYYIIEYFEFQQWGVDYAFADQLSDSVPSVYRKVFIRMVVQYNAYIAPVVCVNDASWKKKPIDIIAHGVAN